MIAVWRFFESIASWMFGHWILTVAMVAVVVAVGLVLTAVGAPRQL